MRILYVHQNFPAQFGHVAAHLAARPGYECRFLSETPPGLVGGIHKLQYKLAGGATQQSHFCSRTFENTIWHCDGVYRAMKALPDYKPDLIVGHSGFGSTLFLRELYPDVPVVNLFEYYYRPHGPDSDMDFRHDLGWELEDMKYVRSRCRNAMILLDLQNCDAAYAPTHFQRSRFPAEYLPKIDCIFDGVDRSVYHAHEDVLRPPLGTRGPRTLAGQSLPAGARVMTYVSRGFESMRGFDIFLEVAARVTAEVPDAHVIVVGADRIAYGGDEQYIAPFKSFKDWCLAPGTHDLSRIHFVGRIPPLELARVLAATDLHLYLTVPFVLSWSMMDAMSCGATVLGSDTPPVAEMVTEGSTGLLADFFDVDALSTKACAVLRDPAAYRPLGLAAERMIAEKYSLEAVLPRMVALYEATVSRGVRAD
jgi:glycosyltransferase involved in cell wall biosynthesis